MPDADLTVTILRQIRERLDATNERLDATTDRLDARLDGLTKRVDEGFDQVSARLTIHETVLRDVLVQLIALNRHVKQKQDPAIVDLLKRIRRLEKKVG